MLKEKQETISISMFKKCPFEKDFIIKCENGKVTSALCKYCSEVSYNELMREAKCRGLKGSVLHSVNYYHNKVTYIHCGTFTRHVGDSSSLHNWCKQKVSDETPEYCVI